MRSTRQHGPNSGTGVTDTYFLVDGDDDIAEYASAGTTETWRYIPGPAINEPVAAITVSSGARRYYMLDHHGSTIAAVNNAGTVIEGPYNYDAYGNCFTTAGAVCPTNTGPFKYVGMRADAESGLYYDRARYYSPVLGRFYQTDPVGYKDDLNLYAYVGNDPINRVDPTGLGCPGPDYYASVVDRERDRAFTVRFWNLPAALSLPLPFVENHLSEWDRETIEACAYAACTLHWRRKSSIMGTIIRRRIG